MTPPYDSRALRSWEMVGRAPRFGIIGIVKIGMPCWSSKGTRDTLVQAGGEDADRGEVCGVVFSISTAEKELRFRTRRWNCHVTKVLCASRCAPRTAVRAGPEEPIRVLQRQGELVEGRRDVCILCTRSQPPA